MNDSILQHSTTSETTMTIINHKGELSAGATAVAGVLTWTDVLHGVFEWGILITGLISGCFAVYWNVSRWLEKKQNDRKSK